MDGQENRPDSVAGKFIVGTLIGGSVALLLDPTSGRRRRAHLKDTAAHAARSVTRAVDKGSRDTANRLRGTVAAAGSLLRWKGVPDQVLEGRVRSCLGRVVSHPSAIEVRTTGGQVVLSGAILESEVDCLLSHVRSVPGVRGVGNRLEVHSKPGNVPDLQSGKESRTGPRSEWMQERWAPATRLLAGSAGAAMMAFGFTRRAWGVPLAIAGAGILFRAAANRNFRQALGIDRDGRCIDVQKTVQIHAPVEEVYALWSRPENFPRIMSHVTNVEKADGHYRWTVTGPAGIPVSWNSVITRDVPNCQIAWKSEPGSVVGSEGCVRFDAVNGGTRVHVRMTYNPMGGVLSHSLAWLMGADPKSALDEDMVRVKSLFEHGKTTAHNRHVALKEMKA